MLYTTDRGYIDRSILSPGASYAAILVATFFFAGRRRARAMPRYLANATMYDALPYNTGRSLPRGSPLLGTTQGTPTPILEVIIIYTHYLYLSLYLSIHIHIGIYVYKHIYVYIYIYIYIHTHTTMCVYIYIYIYIYHIITYQHINVIEAYRMMPCDDLFKGYARAGTPHSDVTRQVTCHRCLKVGVGVSCVVPVFSAKVTRFLIALLSIGWAPHFDSCDKKCLVFSLSQTQKPSCFDGTGRNQQSRPPFPRLR